MVNSKAKVRLSRGGISTAYQSTDEVFIEGRVDQLIPLKDYFLQNPDPYIDFQPEMKYYEETKIEGHSGVLLRYQRKFSNPIIHFRKQLFDSFEVWVKVFISIDLLLRY